ncbi:MAG: hypothetical protein H6677_23540 [Candidatus Obscuribacterales bacterium]|nr:hypothetical protein [Candidatus Obscuribacterales bacterium]
MKALRENCFIVLVAMGILLASTYSSLPVLAQSNVHTKAIEASFYPEAGCPVEVTSCRTLLEIDPFGAPIASRVYITYKNNSTKPVRAVKFRIRYVDAEGKDRGTFHAPDGSTVGVSPGESRSNKWRKEGGLHPDIHSFKIRVFKVLYADGSSWDSLKSKELDEQDDEPAVGQQGSPGSMASPDSSGSPGSPGSPGSSDSTTAPNAGGDQFSQGE